MSARFEPAVEAVLRAAGWYPGRVLDEGQLATFRREVRASAGVFGGRLESSSFATPVLAEFAGLAVESDLPGVELPPRPFILDPSLAAHWAETLIDVDRAHRLHVYPLGIEGEDEAVLAVTDRGSVLAVDAVGEWFLGGTMERALDLLITGRRPRLMTPADGRPPPPWLPREPDPHPRDMRSLGALKRPVGVAFFLPWTPVNLHYVWLPEMLHRIGIEPRPDWSDPGRFRVHDWGGLSCEVHVLDLDSYTVLVLAFEHRAYLGQVSEGGSSDRARPSLPATAPIVRAVCDACVAFAPDLAAGFVLGLPAHDLLTFVADREPDVVTVDGGALLNEDLDLIYLSDGYNFGVSSLPPDQGEVLPVAGGRVLLR